MDQEVIKYYRHLLKEEFPNAGSIENPSIFVEAIGEKLINCGNTGNYMQLYLQITGGRIEDIKYLCSCEPAANVGVEVLCMLVKGKTLDEAAAITEEDLYRLIGSNDEELGKKVRGLLALMNKGIASQHPPPGKKKPGGGDQQGDKISWDGKLSS